MSDAGAPQGAGGNVAFEVNAFLDLLRGAISASRSNGGMLALLIVECGVIDRIDAAWGYHVGDAVRTRVGTLLRAEVLRAGDIISELGRDDFACVLGGVPDPTVAILAAEKSLRALQAPFWIGEEEIYSHASIGIAMFPAHGDEAEDLLQRAKSACVTARALPGRIAEYIEEGAHPAIDRLLRENKLHAAVLEDAFDLVFQPRYDLRLGQMMGVECHLFSSASTLGVVSAVDAFAAAEAAGVVANLTSSILNRALRIVSEFRYKAGLDLRLAVKLPARALMHEEIPDVVQHALGTWNLRAGRMVLEIGEMSVLRQEALARATLSRLKECGVRLSIDDPHMSIDSLIQLANLPFQELNLDLAAARALEAGSKSEAVIRAMIDLAHHLKLDLVALNVVDAAAAEHLKKLGCDAMQGDYRGPAVGAEEFVARYGSEDDEDEDA